MSNSEYNRLANQSNLIGERLGKCFTFYTEKKKSQCALDAYNEIQSMPFNDYGKVAGLKFATSFYVLGLKIDRKQIGAEDSRAEQMRIVHEFDSEIEIGKRRTNEENMKLAQYRQQMFLNAAQLLNPPKNGISCVSQRQGIITTTNCQ